jgi:hypothetical protein
MKSTVAAIILEQLGGLQFITMTGATGFYSNDRELQFSLPGSLVKGRGNKLLIRLRPNDTYTLTLYRVGRAVKVLETVDLVYADNLREVFTRMTGLDTQMPRIRERRFQ